MNKEDKLVKIHEKSIEELRREDDWINKNLSETKTKILTFLGGSLAILSFIFANDGFQCPNQMYGKILYLVGLIICFISISLLFIAIQPVSWQIPTEVKEHVNLSKKDYLLFLKYIKKTYIETINYNLPQYEKKQKLLTIAALLLVIGSMLLLIIKNFNY